jgi:hypothetical protein
MGSNWETKDFGLGNRICYWDNANVTEQVSIRVGRLTFFRSDLPRRNQKRYPYPEF